MAPDQLKSTLENKFKVLCLVDLADINQSISAVYKIFKEYHKETFAPNERLVFYSSHIPSDQLITQSRQAADIIDISRCFILICCPAGSKSLEQPDKQYDLDHFAIQVDSQPLSANTVAISDTMCAYPWMHLSVFNLGQVKPCCVSEDVIGSVTTHTLDSLFNSPQMHQLRSELLAGQKPSGCSICWTQESQNIPSVRQWTLEYNKKQLYSDWIDHPAIRSIDFRPSNVCNFNCRICNPMSSSLIAAEQLSLIKDAEKIVELKNINLKGKWFDNNDQFIDQLSELLPLLENIDFYGGEPFLLKQLPLFLKRATDSNDSAHIRLHFNTNGSIFPINLMPYFEKFKLVDLSFSIDDLHERFEFQRGGSWIEVEHNIELFRNESTVDFNIALMNTVNIQNVLYLEEFFNWADQRGYEIHLNLLESPDYMNIDFMTDAAKKLVVDRYQNHPRPELQKISNRVLNSPGSNGRKFVEYMQNLDRHRKQSFLDSHKEIAIAMGYSV